MLKLGDGYKPMNCSVVMTSMGGTNRPAPAQFAANSSSAEPGEQRKASRERKAFLSFLFGSRLKLLGAILGILSFFLSAFLEQYIILVPILISGIVLWAAGYYRAKTPIPNRSLFAALVIVIAIVGFLLFTGLAFYLRENVTSGFELTIPLALLGLVLGVSGAFLSMVQERLGGGFLLAGPGLALLAALLGGLSLAALVPVSWFGIPVTLGFVFLAKKRASIPKIALGFMGFASVLLPWFAGWESEWFSPTRTDTHFFTYFPSGFVLRDVNLQFFNYILYLGIVPVALVAIGSSTFLASLRAKGSDITRRRRSVLSGILLMIAAVMSGTFLFLVTFLLIITGDKYTQAAGFASAGCWLALLTGTMMAAPLSFNLEKRTPTSTIVEVGQKHISESSSSAKLLAARNAMITWWARPDSP